LADILLCALQRLIRFNKAKENANVVHVAMQLLGDANEKSVLLHVFLRMVRHNDRNLFYAKAFFEASEVMRLHIHSGRSPACKMHIPKQWRRNSLAASSLKTDEYHKLTCQMTQSVMQTCMQVNRTLVSETARLMNLEKHLAQ
jgi:hypothetical protein